jgi:hypothetical protein
MKRITFMVKKILVIVCVIAFGISCGRELGIQEEPIIQDSSLTVIYESPLHGKWHLLYGNGELFSIVLSKGDVVWDIQEKTNRMEMSVLDSIDKRNIIMFRDSIGHYETQYTYAINGDTFILKHENWKRELLYTIETDSNFHPLHSPPFLLIRDGYDIFCRHFLFIRE